jgi:hypothetical protein
MPPLPATDYIQILCKAENIKLDKLIVIFQLTYGLDIVITQSCRELRTGVFLLRLKRILISNSIWIYGKEVSIGSCYQISLISLPIGYSAVDLIGKLEAEVNDCAKHIIIENNSLIIGDIDIYQKLMKKKSFTFQAQKVQMVEQSEFEGKRLIIYGKYGDPTKLAHLWNITFNEKPLRVFEVDEQTIIDVAGTTINTDSSISMNGSQVDFYPYTNYRLKVTSNRHKLDVDNIIKKKINSRELF